MFKTSETRKNLFAAILRAKKNFDAVIKDSTNPYFKSKYESLNCILDATETALNNEGVILLQPSSTDGTANFVTTRLEHVETGEFADSTLKLEKTGNMQEVGAATTYGRRQTLKGLLGLKAEDDDGNTASGKKVETKTTTPTAITAFGVALEGSTFTKTTSPAKKGPGRPSKAAETTKVTKEVTSTNGNGIKTHVSDLLVNEDEW